MAYYFRHLCGQEEERKDRQKEKRNVTDDLLPNMQLRDVDQERRERAALVALLENMPVHCLLTRQLDICSCKRCGTSGLIGDISLDCGLFW